MSIRTWKKEFYPVAVGSVDRLDIRALLQHTLLKWTGALPRNLKKHNLTSDYANGAVISKGRDIHRFPFDGSTCALCEIGCNGCPLACNLGCASGAYGGFRNRGAVLPMLREIRAALKELDATEKAAKRRGKR